MNNGKADVDFELKAEKPNVKLTDTLKFHFYNGNDIPVVAAAGYIPLSSIKTLMEGEKIPPFSWRCNFSSVMVMVNLTPPDSKMTIDLSECQKSCLHKSDMAQHLFSVSSQGVSNILSKKLNVKAENGSPMFLNLMTAHNMENQVTTHMHYQTDVEPTKRDSKRFFKSGLTMTALCEALHATSQTVGKVMSLDTTQKQFTHFVTMVCQSYMRSAHVCPYEFDKVIDSSLTSSGKVQRVVSESFKLPFREPFFGGSSQANFLNADDCEGQATFMLYLFKSFQHMYEKYGAKSQKYHKVFPSHLFKMSDKDKLKLWDLGMKIGKLASVGTLRCDIILIAAGSAALGDGGNQLGGHATCVMVNSSNPNEPFDILMEGTNSMTWDDDTRTITLQLPTELKTMSLVDVANLLTTQIAGLQGDIDKNDSRCLIHLNKVLEGRFYKTAFCQNGSLLATNCMYGKMEYGVDMTNISNYDQKILMPVSPKLINTLSQNDDAHDFLMRHCAERRFEIHPPPVSTHCILDATKPWTPLGLFEEPCELKGREYKVCLTMTSVRDPAQRLELKEGIDRYLANWNKKYNQIGFCSTYVAFDTVFTKLCFWTDNLDALQRTLTSALRDKIKNN